VLGTPVQNAEFKAWLRDQPSEDGDPKAD
jgi:hypothetical protein